MKLLDKNEQMINSGHCAICEQGVDRHTQSVTIDTLYDSELPTGNLMSGRKYICQGCSHDIIKVVGALRPAEVQDMKDKLVEFEGEYTVYVSRIRERLAYINDIANNVGPSVPSLAYVTVPKESLDAEKPVAPKRGRPSKEAF